MKLKYRKLTEDDYYTWELLAKQQFSDEDFCDAEYLTELKDKVKGWCLLNENDEWIGCCFIDNKIHDYNPSGIHFLEICTFPKFRNHGYGKYLLKIMFDNSLTKTKSVCIEPNNEPSIRLFTKYGFNYWGKHKCWNVYICDKSYYPELLKKLELIDISEEITKEEI